MNTSGEARRIEKTASSEDACDIDRIWNNSRKDGKGLFRVVICVYEFRQHLGIDEGITFQ